MGACGQMGGTRTGGGAVPVEHTGRTLDYVAGMEHLDRLALDLMIDDADE